MVRPTLRDEYRGREGDTNLTEAVNLINKTAEEMLPDIADKYAVEECTLPWDRLFEIGIKIKEK